MKKVCILQNGIVYGGTDTFVINLCKRIDKKKFDVTVVNPNYNKSSCVREPELSVTGVRIVHTTPLKSLKGKIRHLFQLYKLLKKGQFDIFQTNIDLFNGPNLFVAWLAGVPLRCCHSHNALQSKQLIEGETMSVRMYQWLMRALCWNFSNRRCGCSTPAMEFLYNPHNWRDSSYPQIINNGIELKEFDEKINVTEKKAELGLSAKYNILTIGHFISQKNPEFIAGIISSLSKRRIDCDLIWIGSGPLKTKVESILNQENCRDRVHFFEKRSDVRDFMKCADVFILPSNFEGLPIVSIESQAAGLPSLLSANITEEANCGSALFIPIDKGPEVWTDCICDILDHKISLRSNKMLLEKFSVENMVNQMTKVFES